MRKCGFIAMLAMLSMCFPVRAEDRNSEFLTSAEVFDFSNLDSANEEVAGLTRKIQDVASQSTVLYLDWEFRFSNEKLSEDFDCNGRVHGDSELYVLPMNTVTNHFLFSVITDFPERYPFNSVSCMLTGGDDFAIRIKGFFVGSVVDIPTAIDVELRPVGLYGDISNPFTNTVTAAYAGPALSFRYDYLDLSQSECLRRGENILVQEQLLSPDNTININDTPFIIGENSEITTIIDCSEVSQNGRVTVMVSHPCDVDRALDWASFLLGSFR